ncbi:hypothetical protein MUY27_15270 [Mucilaginibacter sp. RS28]|uniref:Uncharacterized protein n=1 Tax=Mucilaginibacter straminoryzae TaxID=2932774 RepID=A0A9X1X7F2_9SPHI|nr:hypothetical protein [Mucilaginibacter straminoryzae]MCJ8211078.1 hypothetical protein [Mucilaginibacter straminoryzae]
MKFTVNSAQQSLLYNRYFNNKFSFINRGTAFASSTVSKTNNNMIALILALVVANVIVALRNVDKRNAW